MLRSTHVAFHGMSGNLVEPLGHHLARLLQHLVSHPVVGPAVTVRSVAALELASPPILGDQGTHVGVAPDDVHLFSAN